MSSTLIHSAHFCRFRCHRGPISKGPSPRPSSGDTFTRNHEVAVFQRLLFEACEHIPASFAVLQRLTDRLGEDDALQLSELQDLQEVHHYSDIRHHIVGQISGQDFAI